MFQMHSQAPTELSAHVSAGLFSCSDNGCLGVPSKPSIRFHYHCQWRNLPRPTCPSRRSFLSTRFTTTRPRRDDEGRGIADSLLYSPLRRGVT